MEKRSGAERKQPNGGKGADAKAKPERTNLCRTEGMEERSEAERKQPDGGKGADGRQAVGWVSGLVVTGLFYGL